MYRLLAEQTSIFSREEARLADEIGLSPVELQCLCAMHSAPECSVKELTQALHKSGSQLSRILDVLEDKGLIARSLSRKDRRYVCVVLTDEGAALAARIEEKATVTFSRILDTISSEKIEDVIRFIGLYIELNGGVNSFQKESRSIT